MLPGFRRGSRTIRARRGLGLCGGARKGWKRIGAPAGTARFADGGFGTPSGKVEFHSSAAAAAGARPAAGLHPAARGYPQRARQTLSVGDDLAAGAPLPELEFRQRHELARIRRGAVAGHSSRRRAGAGVADDELRAGVQRSRQPDAAGAGERPRAARRGGGALGVVEEARARRQECQRTHAQRCSSPTWAGRRCSTTVWSQVEAAYARRRRSTPRRSADASRRGRLQPSLRRRPSSSSPTPGTPPRWRRGGSRNARAGRAVHCPVRSRNRRIRASTGKSRAAR